MWSLGGFAFATPWILAGFAVLPVLWFLLRVTPPAPSVVRFPAIRLLFGLVPPEETPVHTPLWLILLRLLLAALLILAMAHPLVNPSAGLPGGGPLLLVVDDGWAASPEWPTRQRVMRDLVDRAEREGRDIAIVTTAQGPQAGKLTLMRAPDARAAITALAPHPWPTDRAAAAKRLDDVPFHSAASYFITDGLSDKGGAEALMTALTRFGPVSAVLPRPDQTAELLNPGPSAAQDLTLTVRRAASGAPAPVKLRALGQDGALLGETEGSFAADSVSTDIAFKLPVELRNRIDRVDLAGQSGAGAALLLDERSRRRPVGIVSDRPEGSQQPLLSDSYYIERALQPFAEVRRGNVAKLVDGSVNMIVLPDGVPDADATKLLTSWVEAGGVLLRFAGPALAEGEDDPLLPVILRRGDRTIGGAMSWETPAHLADFPPDTPYAGLAIPADVTVAKQVLAEPSVDLSSKTWARLTDGTPLVTGQKRGKGWIALVHSSANTEWTNLPLSGLFVDMLRRTSQLGQGVAGAAEGALKPWQVMDGSGRLVAAPPTVQPIAAGALDKTKADPMHPPGLYGSEDAFRAFNLAPSVPELTALGALPRGVVRESFEPAPEFDLRPPLLSAAIVLLLIDILVGYGLRGFLAFGRRATAAGLVLLLAMPQAWAQQDKKPTGPDAAIIAATSDLHLAYVHTGDEDVDRVSREGLTGLGAILSRRTAVEVGDPMELDVEHDEMIFFPLIYWPITATQPALSPAAADRVNRYIATGGTILFDTQDQGTGTPGALGARQLADRLNTLLAGVHIPALVQTPPDHVLNRSFYLIQDCPGRYVGGQLWTEPVADRVNDGVSTVIVGSNDWAAAWAIDERQGMPIYPAVPGGEQQREMAYRFGVNIVMYALTGNYKADQVHVGPILERLGQ